MTRRREDLDIPGPDLLDGPNLVVVKALGRGKGDFVTLFNFPESAEKRVTMTGDHHVSRSTRKRRGGHMAHRRSQDTCTVTFQHDR